MDRNREQQREMQTETLKVGKVEYGRNKFIEISTRKILDEGKENAPFVNLVRGNYDEQGNPRYSKGFGFPQDNALIDALIAELEKHKT